MNRPGSRWRVMPETRREQFSQEALGHLPELLRFATRLVQDGPGAEDLVQETFLEAWRSFDGYAAGSNCRAWLYRILYRTLWRLQRRMPVTEALPAELADPLSAGPGERDVLAARKLRTAYAALPLEARTVVLLADVEGFKYREIAEMLELPIGTVMSRLSRARESLRRRVLADCAGGGGASTAARARWGR